MALKETFSLGIVSGKGGVGKTMFAACLAYSAAQSGHKIVAVDCDVDAPNLHILLKTGNQGQGQPVFGTEKATFLPDKCTQCKKCVDEQFCLFHALSWDEGSNRPSVDALACEGCGACQVLCPSHAFNVAAVKSGEIYTPMSQYGFPVIYGETVLGASTSGKLVTDVKKLAVNTAEQHDAKLVIIDGPPGIGCPVVATISGLNFVVVVTEPTPTAIHDMKRVIEVIRQLNRPFGIVLNKANAWEEGRKAIRAFANDIEVPILGEIPIDFEIPKNIAVGIPPVAIKVSAPGIQALQSITQAVLARALSVSEKKD